ncbi:MAG: DEAD/DEAH box helicase family protein [Chthoniobacter sp.]|nr:DEAD/DEAH box helicase family protein [Chthoniobacter sp.]
MANFEVPNPILNKPFEEPSRFWFIKEGEAPELREGRRPSLVFRPSEQRVEWDMSDGTLKPSPEYPAGYEMVLVNLVRERLEAWKAEGYPGVTRTTLELLKWWQREGRKQRLFYAQLQAVEAIIFLMEARSDFRQGVNVPRDLPNAQKDSKGGNGFLRYALKLATGSGKTTVMGMLAAWSILNKVNDRSERRFSDIVLVVCPNVTIRNRLKEIDPTTGDASLYRTRDLVPEHLMPFLSQGRVIVTNWHVFAPKTSATGGESARVLKTGVRVVNDQLIHIGQKNDTARGKRYLTLETLERQIALEQVFVVPGSEKRDREGNLISLRVTSERYVESDAAVIQRVLGRETAGKQNVLVLNDEAHHAYRVRKDATGEEDLFEEEDETEDEDQFFEEATVWVEGLDRINARCGINYCVDLSATPYFLGRVGQDTNRPFPWTVSDFGLIDAIESGLVKIPQLAVRDTTGQQVAGFFNIWKYVLEKLTPAEKGGKKSSPKPEAVLKHAALPINQLAGLWEEECQRWKEQKELRTPVFIIVCKNTKIAKVIFEWLAERKTPTGLPPSAIEGFRNNGATNTIRVDSKVAFETDSGEAKDDDKRWMRYTLDTVGRLDWSKDSQGRSLYPEGFEALAEKLKRPLHPPGRDVRCIVSVGMLTEGWDCNTVTHVIGLRPFMSQLLCEQVVGRGLRRRTYAENEDGMFSEEVAKVFGVPFDVIPFKQTDGPTPPPPPRHRVHAIPEKAQHKINFPRVVGFTQSVRNRIAVNWDEVPITKLDPLQIPGETQVKGLSISTQGRMSLNGPGRLDRVTLEAFRKKLRLQRVMFDFASDLTRVLITESNCAVPAHKLFPQVFRIVEQYFAHWVKPIPPFESVDSWHSPFYGQILERLRTNIRPDTDEGEAPEIPIYEKNRGLGSTAEVDFPTSRPVWPAERSHVNYVVADTRQWEQSTAYFVDNHPLVRSFVKNAGMGFAVPCFYAGQEHEYIPDFIIRLELERAVFLILECKGRPDQHKDDKAAAARRWVNAVNADERHGLWDYAVAEHPSQVDEKIKAAFKKLTLAAAQAAIADYLIQQLGQRPWATLGRRLGSHFGKSDAHEVRFSELRSLAESLGCSFKDLHKAVETLSHPESGLVERVFVSSTGPERESVSHEEVARMVRGYYLKRSIPQDVWSAWAQKVQVVWRLRNEAVAQETKIPN